MKSIKIFGKTFYAHPMMVVRFVIAMIRFVWTGSKFAPRKLVDERRQTCNFCEHYCKITEQCSICGCFVRLKTSMQLEACPKGKW